MPYTITATLRKNETGEVRTVDIWECPDNLAEEMARGYATWRKAITPEEAVHESQRFQWLENNYSCDCNRILFFHRKELDAGEVTYEELSPDDICYGGGKYDLLKLTVNGKEVDIT
jgi:hypothetical protein